MAISLVDTAVPMNDTGYPVARAKHIWFDDDVSLQDKLDNKELNGGDSSVTLTQEEYELLGDEEKFGGLYYTYDTKRIYKNGIQYGVNEPLELTMAEFKALKEAGALDEKQEYIITTNENGVLLEASDIGYSGTTSGLSSLSVQGAIDEINDKIDNIIDDENVDENTVLSSKKTMEEINGIINDSTTNTTSTWSSSKIASEINPTINISEVFSDGTLNIATLCSTYGAGRYVAVGQGTSGNGTLTIDIWTLVGGAISYIVNALYSPKTSTMFVGYTYENPTIDFDANYFTHCNHIAKVCTLA